ncbi:leucine-rich glioma-inactivated protein 1 isoform X2 [Pelodiscus sinensis]|uniref:leucine-rich glioma-inactivated protein 1 isoform X2 n=1 Tax=Pelodiscus sinensis TaxID=13735 RepID=UPI0003C44BF4|nr:leucine-rich repeat LGI family member 4 isoform X3 [Pelodiscus sinensis]|eukprot:XP_006123567.1 leucine-rich repeat LGI family member 4 isoform X3 [Pelodiscus sinensis]
MLLGQTMDWGSPWVAVGRGGLCRACAPLLVAVLLLAAGSGERHRAPRRKCPISCSCIQDNALCDRTDGVPRGLPPDITSLSLVRSGFTELREGSFLQTPTLQLLLFTASTLGLIRDDAFVGLLHLEYLFIENNKVGSISKNALRGLKGLVHLSLAHNQLETLPRHLFRGLDALTHVDLRGNPFHCDCRIKWLVEWLDSTNASAELGECQGPTELNGTRLSQLHLQDFDCITTGSSPVACKPLVVEGRLLVVLAQLAGGSHVWRREEDTGHFVRLQELGPQRIRKPNALASFRVDGDWFLAVADSSKAGATTLFRWGGRGFYAHQALHAWHRDTHVEFLELAGRPSLILASSSQRPVVYQWSRPGRAFLRHTDIPDMDDVYAVKHFRLRGDVYICLTRFIGDSKVMRWEGSMFRDVQHMPSRGSMVFQPLGIGSHRYAVLGNDYSFSQVYRYDARSGLFVHLQELNTQAPRSFAHLAIHQRDFVFAASFKGDTQIYRHITIDLSA